MCEVTVIIPNYNGKTYLIPCLKALYENTKIEIEVIIVDNGSTDNSIKNVEEVYPQVRIIQLDKNYGFCVAVNEGIKYASTAYVLLLNNDTEIRKGFVEYLLRRIKQSDKIFSVEAKMIQYQNRNLIDSAGTYYNALGWAFARGKDQFVKKYNRCSRVFASCAGAAIYRKRVFDEIGLFDERHFAYLEDIDIGYRARIQGYWNLYEPKAQVIHVGSASSGSRYNEFKVSLSSQNNIYVIYKNMPAWQIALNFPLLFIGFVAKMVFFYKKGFGRVYIRGLYEGMKMCERKYRFVSPNSCIKNYLLIQLELWNNIIKKFVDMI